MKVESANPVRLTQQLAAAPDTVFEAWVRPALMRRWLFVGDGNEIRSITLNLRVGGSFSILERNDGEDIDHFGRYLEIERPRRLSFTLEVPKHFPGVMTITVEIEPSPSGSVMRFTQTGVDREVTEGNWRTMFDTLARVLGSC